MTFPFVKRANTKNTNTKYINTAYDEVPKRPYMWYILKKKVVQGYQKLYSHGQMRKYKKTNAKYINTA